MIELKFKLKKDGKCVGYMRIVGGDVEVRSPAGRPEFDWVTQYRLAWCGEHVTKEIDFDSAHPFVFQDRNGKDVYEGDAVTWWEHGYEHDSLVGTVELDRIHQRWALCSPVMYPMRPEDVDLDIELIEDKP